MSGKTVNLLAQMSLDEKVQQLSGYMFFDDYWNKHDSNSQEYRISFIENCTPDQMMGEDGIGFVTTQLRDLPPGRAAKIANRTQTYIQEHTRLKIPAIIHDEGLHGLIACGATVFPSALAMAASWNEDLFGEVASAIGREARVRGVRQLLSPTLNLALDPRCGRTEETYGEDPLLASRFGVAYIQNVQQHGVVCTPKHFVANFEADGGRDSWPCYLTERALREVFFPPFEAAVREGGALSLMNAYNTLDGVPCAGHPWLLTTVLREEWGFEGYVVSDYVSVILQYKLHGTAKDEADAAIQSLDAGLDIELPRFECFGEPLRQALGAGEAREELVDNAVARLLDVKERIGLFDDYLADPDDAERVTNCAEHRELAQRIAGESLVLLKNDGTLPLSSQKRIAVIGPNADAVELGIYTYDLQPREKVVTPLDGIRASAGGGVSIVYEKGCELTGEERSGFDAAIAAVGASDAAVVVVGSSEKLAGEARDRADLDLTGLQEELILAAADTGKPVVVVMITGSVHTMEHWHDKVSAILHAWYPGEQGGHAIGRALFGIDNPSGKLPLTIPRETGQCPIYYHHKPSGRGHEYYRELGCQGTIRYPFGHGMSYTSFEYMNLEISPASATTHGVVEVMFDLKNAGDREGVEIAQLYVRDRVASVARPLQELKGWKRVKLAPGETRRVAIVLPVSDLALYNRNMEKVVEPGTFDIRIGASATDIRLRGQLEVTSE